MLRLPLELLFSRGECFPQCHASTLLALESGEILVAYFAGAHEKADDTAIWLSRKAGGAWRAPVKIAKVAPIPHWNPVLAKTRAGVRLSFKVGKEIREWQSYTCESFDGGITWTTPVPYGPPNGAGGPVRSHPLPLPGGAWLAPNSDETETAWRPRVDISRDEGASYARLSPIPINADRPRDPHYIAGKGAIQPALFMDAKGRVHALLRTTCGEVFRSCSDDMGKSWSEARPAGIPNNNSGIDACAACGKIFLALNPVAGNWAARTPLCLYLSEADGQTFRPFAVLADDKLDEIENAPAEFSYPSLYASLDALYISFTYHRRQIACAKLSLPV